MDIETKEEELEELQKENEEIQKELETTKDKVKKVSDYHKNVDEKINKLRDKLPVPKGKNITHSSVDEDPYNLGKAKNFLCKLKGKTCETSALQALGHPQNIAKKT